MRILTLLFSLSFCCSLIGQEPAYNFINANNVKTGMHSNGSLFFDENRQNAGYWVPYFGAGIGPATVFSAGIWLSAEDDAGNFYISQLTYGSVWQPSEFKAGAINTTGSNIDYNQVWKVTKTEIDALIEDFQDGTIDDTPSDQLLNWPGTDPALVGQELAPFFDQNEDGVYNPMDGDYPSITLKGMDCIPDEMIYTIYHDDPSSNSNALGVEVHTMLFAFESDSDEILNNTAFTRIKVVNKSQLTYKNFRVGLWLDPDLGCFTDDYTGCDVERNSIFVYNQDNTDGETGGFCPAGVNTFLDNPPVMNFTFLNQDLKSFMGYYNPAIGNAPVGTLDPFQPREYFNLMNAVWRDGTPLTRGNLGFNPGSNDITSYAFDGDPNDSSQWSMFETQVNDLDQRTVSTVGIDVFEDSFSVDIASIYTRSGMDHLTNVTVGKDEVDHIQEFYNEKFTVSTIDEFVKESIHIFPIPSSGKLNIEHAHKFDQCLVLNALGHVVYKEALNQAEITLDVSPGIYTIGLRKKGSSEYHYQKIVMIK